MAAITYQPDETESLRRVQKHLGDFAMLLEHFLELFLCNVWGQISNKQPASTSEFLFPRWSSWDGFFFSFLHFFLLLLVMMIWATHLPSLSAMMMPAKSTTAAFLEPLSPSIVVSTRPSVVIFHLWLLLHLCVIFCAICVVLSYHFMCMSYRRFSECATLAYRTKERLLLRISMCASLTVTWVI